MEDLEVRSATYVKDAWLPETDSKAALPIEPTKELVSQLQQAELALSGSTLSACVQAKLLPARLGAAAQNQSPAQKRSGAPQSASSPPAADTSWRPVPIALLLQQVTYCAVTRTNR